MVDLCAAAVGAYHYHLLTIVPVFKPHLSCLNLFTSTTPEATPLIAATEASSRANTCEDGVRPSSPAGVPASIVHYDPAAITGVEKIGKAFPFRPIHFYSYPAKALEVLDWKPKHGMGTGTTSHFYVTLFRAAALGAGGPEFDPLAVATKHGSS